MDGSRSLFDLLLDDDAAINDRASEVSLAKAVRCASFHCHAPESHASLSATVWSMSTRVRSEVRTPSYGDSQSASTTKHLNGSTCGKPMASRFNTCSRASQPSPSMSSQCLNRLRLYPREYSFCTVMVISTSMAKYVSFGPCTRTSTVWVAWAPALLKPIDIASTAPAAAIRMFMRWSLPRP